MNVIGVDVGTSSVRLAIVQFSGESYKDVRVLASESQDIPVYKSGVSYEQSSYEIWNAICNCNKQCLQKSKISADSIKAIGFSATCSLVMTGESGNEGHEIIMWMDHRARDVAREITASGAKVLDLFGGTCSPEFSLAKLFWIRKNRPSSFDETSGFFELPDWLVQKCLNKTPCVSPRSLCCTTCKWGREEDSASVPGYQEYLKKNCGRDIFDKIGSTVLKPGSCSGKICDKAKVELGLMDKKDNSLESRREIFVATSLIDAHAGMLAMLSAPLTMHGLSNPIDGTLCSLAGTSTCHLALSKEKVFTRGVWGPYKDVVLDGYYLHEAGQTLTGKLIEHMISIHELGKEQLKTKSMEQVIFNLNTQEQNTKAKQKSRLHILPSFHGNRCPLANSRLKGAVYGLCIEKDATLLDYYVATIESLVYETKFIVETLKHLKLTTVLVSGGLMKNSFYMQTMANVLGMKTIRMSLKSVDFMVLGASLLARHSVLESEIGNDGDKALTLNDSIVGLKYNEIETKVYEPTYVKYDKRYYEKGYKSYKVLVEASEKIDNILHNKNNNNDSD